MDLSASPLRFKIELKWEIVIIDLVDMILLLCYNMNVLLRLLYYAYMQYYLILRFLSPDLLNVDNDYFKYALIH